MSYGTLPWIWLILMPATGQASSPADRGNRLNAATTT
jgi:hypothetical protein